MIKRIAYIFTIGFIYLVFYSNVSYAKNPYIELTNRFVSGATNIRGSLQDRLIEGAIEASTPEADEQTRRIQRSAVKYMLTNDKEKSRKYWRDVENGIQDVVQKKAETDYRETSAYRNTAPKSKKKCKIVNLGKPPGTIDIQSGCFNRQCSKLTGVFDVDMGWGVSGGDGPMAGIDMEVSVYGDRASIQRSGFQTLDWFENVTVIRKGDILIFGHDDKTTFAMGSKENKEPVSGHRFYGAKGEYFSLFLPPDVNSKAIVHFGILEPEDVLERVCK